MLAKEILQTARGLFDYVPETTGPVGTVIVTEESGDKREFSPTEQLIRLTSVLQKEEAIADSDEEVEYTSLADSQRHSGFDPVDGSGGLNLADDWGEEDGALESEEGQLTKTEADESTDALDPDDEWGEEEFFGRTSLERHRPLLRKSTAINLNQYTDIQRQRCAPYNSVEQE